MQGNSLGSYLYLKLAKSHVSHFIFYVFLFYKIRKQEDGRGRSSGTGGRRKVV
jgi:hypothetical protein